MKATRRKNAVGPTMIKKWAGKSVGGYTVVDRTDRMKHTYYLWSIRCNTCGVVQAEGDSPARMKAMYDSGSRRLCENPACTESVPVHVSRAKDRRQAVAAVVEAGGNMVTLADRLGVTKERARQILDAAMPADRADDRLAAATREQLLAAVMKRPKAQRRLVALALEPDPETP